MSHALAPGDSTSDRVRQAVREVTPFVAHFARFGFASQGLVYLVIGFLAALTPVGLRREPTGWNGALGTLLRQPAGWILLGVVALGLFAFGLWQMFRAVEDPEYDGTRPTGIAKRIGYAFNACVQFTLATAAAAMAIGWRHSARGGDDRHVRDWTAWALSHPFGRFVLGVVGVGILAYGVQQVACGVFGRLDTRLALHELSRGARAAVMAVSRFGVAARGGVFGLLGTFLIKSAYDVNASEARGISGTLRTIASEPYGKWLLGMCALGLIAYGMYDFVLARYRMIRV